MLQKILIHIQNAENRTHQDINYLLLVMLLACKFTQKKKKRINHTVKSVFKNFRSRYFKIRSKIIAVLAFELEMEQLRVQIIHRINYIFTKFLLQ